MGISDKLIIGYDLNGDDMACLIILKQDKGKNKIVNSIFGSLAETLYDELCGVHDREYKEISKQVEQLKAENAKLKSQLAEAMELVEILKAEIPTTGCEQCYNCINDISNKLHTCVFLKYDDAINFKWQHQDRYEKLKSEAKPNESPITT